MHAVVHVAALEAYPVTLPNGVFPGAIAVPYTWKEQEDVAGLDAFLASDVRAEETIALKEIKHLVFVQFTAFVHVEIIAVGMAFCGVVFALAHVIIAHGTHRKAPFGIALIGYKVFAVLHGLMCLMLWNACA